MTRIPLKALAAVALLVGTTAPARAYQGWQIGTWTHTVTVDDHEVKVKLEVKADTIHCTVRTRDGAAVMTITIEADYVMSRDGIVIGILAPGKAAQKDSAKKEGKDTVDERVFTCRFTAEKNGLVVTDLNGGGNDKNQAKKVFEGKYRRAEGTTAPAPTTTTSNAPGKTPAPVTEGIRGRIVLTKPASFTPAQLALIASVGGTSEPPSLVKLADDDKNTKVSVAVLTVSNLEARDNPASVERELHPLVVKQLGNLCKKNGENVEVVPVPVIERYKASHPDWNHPLNLIQIGKDLKVRYVACLEINSLSLYVPKSNNQFYQGETDIKVTLVNVRKPDDLPETDRCHETYPSTPISTFDEPNPMAFRSKFLDHVAEKISWEFSKHPKPQDE